MAIPAKTLAKALDRNKRIGRIQRHLDQFKPALDQRLDNRFRLIGTDAAQDRDERALSPSATALACDISELRSPDIDGGLAQPVPRRLLGIVSHHIETALAQGNLVELAEAAGPQQF